MKVIKITPHPEGSCESCILAWPEQQSDVVPYLQSLAESEGEAFLSDYQKRTITIDLVSMTAEEVLATVDDPSDDLRRACDEEVAEKEATA